MPTVTMPQLGESVTEGTIGKWLKQVGDPVAKDEPIVEVITDKVNAEVPSPFEGVLVEILVAEGAIVPNDAGIAVVEAAGAAEGRTSLPSEGPAAAAPPADAPAPEAPGPQPPAAEVPAAGAAVPDEPAVSEAAADEAHVAAAESASQRPAAEPAGAPPAGGARADASSAAAAAATSEAPARTARRHEGNGTVGGRMTPAVRRLAREHGVDLAAVEGSGLGGRITREDVVRQAGAPAAQAPAPEPATPQEAEPPATASAPAAAAGDSLKDLSPMRKAIAAQMSRSLDVPVAYLTVEVDMTSVVRRREAVRRDYEAREGKSLSYVAFVTKACVEALRKHPDLNAHWTDEGHWRRKAVNVGIAVAVEDGLVVPVVRNADGLSLHGLNGAINDAADRARTKRLRMDDIQGGTFTVDNTGWTGSILTLPILNPPEVAIVTMEKIVKRPVVIEGPSGDAIAVRSMMNMVIGFDHRATDGAQAGRFLSDVKGWLESVDAQTSIW
jgi:pyruvate/2-oxoglutarate dehydrogenase complex dihydrolipoamide acyltransferase (E2) component